MKMYDSVTPGAIPVGAGIVAGYLDGLYRWSTNDWLLFPDAVKVGIVVKASTNMGQVLDVEVGDALPSEAPGWVTMRRQAGQVRPSVYMNASTWPAVRQAFVKAGVPEPDYWVAQYDGDPAIPPGAVAKQYLGYPGAGSPGPYDVSSTDGVWPLAPHEEDAMPVAIVQPANDPQRRIVVEKADGTVYVLRQDVNPVDPHNNPWIPELLPVP